MTSNTNEVNDDLYLNKDTPQEIKPQASAVNLSSEETLGVDEKEALKEDSGLLFKKESTDARMELIYTAKKSIKGKGSKEVLNLLNSLYKSNKSFSYKELKKRVLDESRFLKKNGEPIKSAQDLLDIFKNL